MCVCACVCVWWLYQKLTANLLLYIAIFFTKSLHLIFTGMRNKKLHIISSPFMLQMLYTHITQRRYRIVGKFGGVFNLAVFRKIHQIKTLPSFYPRCIVYTPYVYMCIRWACDLVEWTFWFDSSSVWPCLGAFDGKDQCASVAHSWRRRLSRWTSAWGRLSPTARMRRHIRSLLPW